MNRRTFLKFLAATAAALTIKHKPQDTPVPPAPTTITTGSVVDVRQLYNQNFQLLDSYTVSDPLIKWSEYSNPVRHTAILRAKQIDTEAFNAIVGNSSSNFAFKTRRAR